MTATEPEPTRDVAALQRLPETDSTPDEETTGGPGCMTTGVGRVPPEPDTDPDRDPDSAD